MLFKTPTKKRKPRLFSFVLPNLPIAPGKKQFMKTFVDGATEAGLDTYIYTRLTENVKTIFPDDFLFIWGFNYRAKAAIKFWKDHGGNEDNVIYFEGNVLKAKEKIPASVYRFPIKSIYADGDFMDSDDYEQKYKELAKHVDLTIHPWKNNPDGHILIYMNRGGEGWGHFDVPVWPWLEKTIKEIRKVSNRKIIVKDHPGRVISCSREKEQQKSALKAFDKNVKFYHNVTKDLKDNEKILLDKAHAAVILGSTAGAISMMNGIPTFATHEKSFINRWSAGELKDIENPIYPDREAFIREYVNSHWVLETEIARGDFFNKLLRQRYKQWHTPPNRNI